jgi:phosphoenolpyruvate carboxykinase (GTP)
VPIDAIIFGGRRATTMPLVFQSFNWVHGVFLGANMGSEMTAAAAGTIGKVRRDPMAMLPFCGYNMGDYFKHWLHMRRRIGDLPRVFHVNWFRKDKDGKFLWPGFGENMRVLEWIVNRCRGSGRSHEAPLGWMPRYDEINMTGLDGMTQERFDEIMRVDHKELRQELLNAEELYLDLYDYLPKELVYQRELLAGRF